MSEYKVLSVRMKTEDYERVFNAAKNEHLKASTWVKQITMQAVEQAERAGDSVINAPESEENTEIHTNTQQK